jgi:FAD:protein FMN transferase
MSALLAEAEAVERFACFGGECAVIVSGYGPAGAAPDAAARAKRRLLDWHHQFSRFEPDSELSMLNRDARATVPVGPVMALIVEAAVAAAELTCGLADPTLVGALERAGYTHDLPSAPIPLAEALALAPARRPARPSSDRDWQGIVADKSAGTVTRPPGVRLDSGGVAKGMFTDLLAALLAQHPGFAIDACGDVRLGGSALAPRSVGVLSPFDGAELHTFELVRGAAATSGVGRRSWLGASGAPAHHLLDPSTGRPAFTGVVQATALASSGARAEALAKAAVLSGPEAARDWLPHGGLVVYDSGELELVPGPADGIVR